MAERADEFELYDLAVRVERIEGQSTCAMKPGDTVYAPLELDNTGTLGLNYGMKYATTTTGQDLAPALKRSRSTFVVAMP